MNYITGFDISSEQMLKMADTCHAHLWPSKKNPFFKTSLKKRLPNRLNVLTTDITDDKLRHLFDAGICHIIDANATEQSIYDFLIYKPAKKTMKSLGFLLTCPTIYSCDVAQIFTYALHTQLNFSQHRQDKIHLALHEALVNGLIHGNLHLSSELRQSIRDFVKYSEILNERLNNPQYAQKSVRIWANWNHKKLEIKIKDEGAGYEVNPLLYKKSDAKAKSGRGLRLIAGTADSCTIDDFGREITLSFMLDTTEHYQVSDSLSSHEQKTSGADLVSDLSACRVLIMEDNPSNRTLSTRLLNVAGIIHVETASDGIEGLQMVAKHKPDLIILDIAMPRMNGYEVLYHLKNSPETQDIPVLIQTASDTRETRDKTFSSGATDFISKPINPLEFFARVKVHLENKLLISRLQHQLSQLDTELQSAQMVQADMLPSQPFLDNIKEKYRLDIVHHFEPSSRIGGDFWHLFPISPTQIAVYLCDFSGHGVAAALHTVRLHTLISQMNKNLGNPSGFLQKINLQLYDLLPRGQFATFFCCIIDIEHQTITYSGAGAPPLLLHTNNNIVRLETRGLPLGIAPRSSYEDQTLSFHPGDTLFLFSDAFPESPDVNGVRLGMDGFEKMVQKPMTLPNTSAGLQQIMEAFFKYAPPPPPDDATAVLIRFLPS